MNVCEQCGKEYQAKRATSRYCSSTCRSRAKRGLSVAPDSVASLSVAPEPHYATRAKPELLNWGRPMSSAELADSQYAANRVPIPGDHDYVGCCECVDGRWVVKGKAGAGQC